jgi:3-phosphoglycerate kinase
MSLTQDKVIARGIARLAKVRADRNTPMQDFNKMIDDLKRTHDEIRLKVHLGAKDLQDEWSHLEKRWHGFERKAELERSAKEVSKALTTLGLELKTAFARVRSAL